MAPGIDIERDILAHMDFRRSVETRSRWTRASFRPALMGLRDRMLETPLERRFSYDAQN